MIPETMKAARAARMWNELCATVAGVDAEGGTADQITPFGLLMLSHDLPFLLTGYTQDPKAPHAAEKLAARLDADAEALETLTWKHSFENPRIEFERVTNLWVSALTVDDRFRALLASHGAASFSVAVPSRREEIPAGDRAFAEFLRSFAAALRRN